MKRKLVKTLMAIIINAILTGCSFNMETENAVNEVMNVLESQPEEAEELSSANLTAAIEAEVSEKSNIGENEATPNEDNNKEEEPSSSEPEESRAINEPAEPTKPAPEISCEIYPLDADMYAKCEANLRIGPHIDFEQKDTLDAREKVHVTGLTSNGWFLLENELYVYIDYLTSTESETSKDLIIPGAEFEVLYADKEMYASINCNLRIAPNIDFAKAGALSKGDAVHVVGQVSTGWYRLENGLFVSMTCLTGIKPEEPVQPTEPSEPTQPEEPTEPSQPVEPTEPTQPSEPEQPEEPTEPSEPETQEYTYEIYLLPELLTLVNDERTANGVNTFEWATDKEEDAKARARELVDDFSHGSPGGYSSSTECITMYGPDVQDIYNAYKNSPMHYTALTIETFCTKFVSANCEVYLNGEFVDNYNVVMAYRR